MAADNTLSISLSTDFPGRNDAPANGSFQARMHLAVEGLAAGQLVPAVTWFNTSTAWVDFDLDAPDPLTMVLPTDASGMADLRVELRTEANVSLVFEEDGTTFVLDAQAPTLLGSSPNQAAYVDQRADRNVIMSFAEVGGFHPDDVAFHVWVEDETTGKTAASTTVPRPSQNTSRPQPCGRHRHRVDGQLHRRRLRERGPCCGSRVGPRHGPCGHRGANRHR